MNRQNELCGNAWVPARTSGDCLHTTNGIKLAKNDLLLSLVRSRQSTYRALILEVGID